MPKQGRRWRYPAILTILASCGLGVFAGVRVDQKIVAKPLPPEIVKAWRNAGAEVGWVKKANWARWSFALAKKARPGLWRRFGSLLGKRVYCQSCPILQ